MARMDWSKNTKKSRIYRSGSEQITDFGDVIDRAHRANKIAGLQLTPKAILKKRMAHSKKNSMPVVAEASAVEQKQQPQADQSTQMREQQAKKAARLKEKQAFQAPKNQIEKNNKQKNQKNLTVGRKKNRRNIMSSLPIVTNTGSIVGARAKVVPDWSIPSAEPKKNKG